MKPIEIHIEGYKIVISEDKKISEAIEADKADKADKVGEVVDIGADEKQKIVYVPYPLQEKPLVGDWWRYPWATWGNDIVLTTTYTTS